MKNINTHQKILIIGKIPPPIGGVTIHVSRLLEYLKENKILYHFYDLSSFSLFDYVKKIRANRIIHLNCSSPYFRFFTVIINLFLKRKLIITYHGNLGRWGLITNLIDYLSVFLCQIPIILNDSSLNIAKKYNKCSIKCSAFIPPEKTKPSIELFSVINIFKKKYHTLFCTNAFDVTFDKKGNEIYGIKELLDVFSTLKDSALIFSDPSGNYIKFLKQENIKIPENILIIDYPHSFIDVIKETDCFIRNTTTDGDSLSVKEALWLQKIVIASDCVSRHAGVLTYKIHDKNDLIVNIRKIISRNKQSTKKYDIANGAKELFEIYSTI